MYRSSIHLSSGTNSSVPAIIRFLGYDPRPTPTTFGQRLVHLRGTYGLSQRMLARRLGVDILTLRRWEKDQHQPAKTLLRKLERSFPGLMHLILCQNNIVFDPAGTTNKHLHMRVLHRTLSK
jgi:DNA-binding XRE family transcriptional regulator